MLLQRLQLLRLEAGDQQRPRPMVHRLVDAEPLGGETAARVPHRGVETTAPALETYTVLVLCGYYSYLIIDWQNKSGTNCLIVIVIDNAHYFARTMFI